MGRQNPVREALVRYLIAGLAAVVLVGLLGVWLARRAGELAARFETSRPAVSRHLRVLREQGLVQARLEGRRRVYWLDPEPLEELDEWLSRYRGFWTNRLDALGVEL